MLRYDSVCPHVSTRCRLDHLLAMWVRIMTGAVSGGRDMTANDVRLTDVRLTKDDAVRPH